MSNKLSGFIAPIIYIHIAITVYYIMQSNVARKKNKVNGHIAVSVNLSFIVKIGN